MLHIFFFNFDQVFDRSNPKGESFIFSLFHLKEMQNRDEKIHFRGLGGPGCYFSYLGRSLKKTLAGSGTAGL